jgi:nucleoid DNA-binding protein
MTKAELADAICSRTGMIKQETLAILESLL